MELFPAHHFVYMDRFMDIIKDQIAVTPIIRERFQTRRSDDYAIVRLCIEEIGFFVVTDHPEVNPFILDIFDEKRLWFAPGFRVRDGDCCGEGRLIV